MAKRFRDIYESTEKEYDTSGYRKRLCREWLDLQQLSSAKVHIPTVLDSEAPAKTQHLHAHKRHKPNIAPMKVAANLDKNTQFRVDARSNVNDRKIFEPFFLDENHSNNQNMSKVNHTQQISMNRKHNMDKLDEESYHRSVARLTQKQHPEKRPARNLYSPNLGLDEFNFDIPSEHFSLPEKIKSSKKLKKETDCSWLSLDVEFEERRRPNERTDFDAETERRLLKITHFERKLGPMNELFDIDERDKDKYKHRNRNHAELHASQRHIAKKKPNDACLHNRTDRKRFGELPHMTQTDRHALQRYEKNALDYRKTNHDDERQHVVLNGGALGFPAMIKANEGTLAFRTGSSHTATQPIICNIECKNLTIKFD